MVAKLKYIFEKGTKIGYFEVLETNTTSKVKVQCICGKQLMIEGCKLQTKKSCGCMSKTLREQTNLKKYGVENISQLNETKQKIKNITQQKYNVDNISQVQTIKQKKKQTWLQNLGVENPSQSKIILEKKCKQSRNKYGFDHPFQSEKVKQKIKKTNLERYGCCYSIASEQVREKATNTIKQKYGVDNVRKSKIIKQKIKQTKLEKYGFPHKRECFLSNGQSLREICDQYDVLYPHAYKILHKYGEQMFFDYVKSGPRKTSLELFFKQLLKDHFPDLDLYNRKPKEFKCRNRPDFRLEKDQKIIYINTDGLYYHSEIKKKNDYHIKLREKFQNNNQILFQFREEEVLTKGDIITSMIVNYFGDSDKIDARKCKVESNLPKSQVDQFFEKNHLMGTHSTAKGFVLKYQDQIVCAISVRRKKQNIEISRFATLLGYNVRGGFSKLLHHVIKLYKPQQVISYCDLRYSSGHTYQINKFKLESITLGWQWTDLKTTYNRLKCKANMDERKLTQTEYSDELGWFKIYDAGQARYVLTLT